MIRNSPAGSPGLLGGSTGPIMCERHGTGLGGVSPSGSPRVHAASKTNRAPYSTVVNNTEQSGGQPRAAGREHGPENVRAARHGAGVRALPMSLCLSVGCGRDTVSDCDFSCY